MLVGFISFRTMGQFIHGLSGTPACQAGVDYSDAIEKGSQPSVCQEESHSSNVTLLALLSHPSPLPFFLLLGWRRRGEEERGQERGG